jgi:hypothetical protein
MLAVSITQAPRVHFSQSFSSESLSSSLVDAPGLDGRTGVASAEKDVAGAGLLPDLSEVQKDGKDVCGDGGTIPDRVGAQRASIVSQSPIGSISAKFESTAHMSPGRVEARLASPSPPNLQQSTNEGLVALKAEGLLAKITLLEATLQDRNRELAASRERERERERERASCVNCAELEHAVHELQIQLLTVQQRLKQQESEAETDMAHANQRFGALSREHQTLADKLSELQGRELKGRGALFTSERPASSANNTDLPVLDSSVLRSASAILRPRSQDLDSSTLLSSLPSYSLRVVGPNERATRASSQGPGAQVSTVPGRFCSPRSASEPLAECGGREGGGEGEGEVGEGRSEPGKWEVGRGRSEVLRSNKMREGVCVVRSPTTAASMGSRAVAGREPSPVRTRVLEITAERSASPHYTSGLRTSYVPPVDPDLGVYLKTKGSKRWTLGPSLMQELDHSESAQSSDEDLLSMSPEWRSAELRAPNGVSTSHPASPPDPLGAASRRTVPGGGVHFGSMEFHCGVNGNPVGVNAIAPHEARSGQSEGEEAMRAASAQARLGASAQPRLDDASSARPYLSVAIAVAKEASGEKRPRRGSSASPGVSAVDIDNGSLHMRTRAVTPKARVSQSQPYANRFFVHSVHSSLIRRGSSVVDDV